MRAHWTLLVVALGCNGGARSDGASQADAVCKHMEALEKQASMVPSPDDLVRCATREDRIRTKLGDAAYATYAACQLDAQHLPEAMACDPRGSGSKP